MSFGVFLVSEQLCAKAQCVIQCAGQKWRGMLAAGQVTSEVCQEELLLPGSDKSCI